MNTGSYNFEALNDLQFQVERLRQQAFAVRGLESGILRSAGLKPAHDVLELGCGPGFVTDLLAELAPDGGLYAIEPSADLLAKVEGNVSKKPARGLHLVRAYGDSLPMPDGSVDFSYARFVLQHVPRPEDVFREIYRVTRPGGRFCAVDSDDGLVIFYPEHAGVGGVVRAAQEAQSAKGGDRFIGRKLQQLMARAGFANSTSRILSLTSTELPFKVLFNILLGYKASLLGEAVDVKRLYEELAAEVSGGRLSAAGGVFIVTGEKI